MSRIRRSAPLPGGAAATHAEQAAQPPAGAEHAAAPLWLDGQTLRGPLSATSQPQRDLTALLRWPSTWLLRLPAGTTLLCAHVVSAFTFTTARAVFEDARRRRAPVLGPADWAQLCEAAQDRRAALALEFWLRPSSPPPPAPEPPDWALPPQPLAAMLGAPTDLGVSARAAAELSVAAVLDHFGARAVELLEPSEAAP